jgi:hypothetical protein
VSVTAVPAYGGFRFREWKPNHYSVYLSASEEYLGCVWREKWYWRAWAEGADESEEEHFVSAVGAARYL